MVSLVTRSGPKSSRSPATIPPGLRASRATVGGEEVAIFSYPLARPALPASLSPAEGAVALALLEGLSNGDIARARKTSARTVANQVASIFRKLGLSSRGEVAMALSRLQGS